MSVSVVGFDIGNSTSFVAVAKGGGIETIDNEYSDRCTPTYVSFGDKNRFVGAAAKQQAITNINNTIFNFSRLIGKKFSDPVVQRELPFLPFKVVQLENDGIGITCQYLNESTTFTPEQVMAIQLTKLKEITENHLKSACIDVVINVPTYYTDTERRAMLDASFVAGLNCVRLVNDTTACGIAYGLYNKDLPEPDKPPRHVAFVMMGQSNLQVAICAFNNGKMKVLATRSDANLGGRDFDHAIFKHLCGDILQRYKLDVVKNAKATVRLLQECEKLKKLMSANSTRIPLNIECFMEDKDINCGLQRNEFEALIADELSRFEKTISECIQLAKMTPADISFVELVGGSTRVPCIKALVAKVFGQEGRTTLNSDEAVARGCALQAAICSPAFKVREFSVTDACPFAVKLIAHGEPEPLKVDIFPHLHPIPSNRQIDLKRRADFDIEAFYAEPGQLPNQNMHIGRFAIRNVRVPEGAEMAKLQIKIRMNRHGIFNISHAQIVEPYQKEVEVDMTPEELAEQQPMEVEPAAGEEKPAVPKKKVTKTFNRYVDLHVDCVAVPQLSETELNLCKERECQMIQNDRLERERSNAKNALEEYIYDMRDKLGGALEQYVLEADREKFSAELTKMEDWLYDEGEDMPKQPYVERLQALRDVGDQYVMRMREAEARPAAMERLAQAIVHVEKVIEAHAGQAEAYDHLTADEVAQLHKAVEEKRKWFEQECNAQNSRPLHENPSVYVSEIKHQTDAFLNATNPIVTKKKPVTKPPPQPETPKENAANGHPEANGKEGTANNNINNNPPDLDGADLKGKTGATGNEEADCMDLD